MANSENGRIVETPTEARQAEPGPSVLLALANKHHSCDRCSDVRLDCVLSNLTDNLREGASPRWVETAFFRRLGGHRE